MIMIFFVENVDVFENCAGYADFNLVLVSLVNEKSTKLDSVSLLSFRAHDNKLLPQKEFPFQIASENFKKVLVSVCFLNLYLHFSFIEKASLRNFYSTSYSTEHSKIILLCILKTRLDLETSSSAFNKLVACKKFRWQG